MATAHKDWPHIDWSHIDWPHIDWLLDLPVFVCFRPVADLRGGAQGTRAPPPWGPKFLHFHAVFGEN